MRVIYLSHLRALCSGLAIAVATAGSATAGFIQPVAPAWAGGPNTTSQIWSSMAPGATVPTAATPQSPTDSTSNPNGTAAWYDASSPADSAFVIPTDVYSPSAPITPTAVVPGYNLP